MGNKRCLQRQLAWRTTISTGGLKTKRDSSSTSRTPNITLSGSSPRTCLTSSCLLRIRTSRLQIIGTTSPPMKNKKTGIYIGLTVVFCLRESQEWSPTKDAITFQECFSLQERIPWRGTSSKCPRNSKKTISFSQERFYFRLNLGSSNRHFLRSRERTDQFILWNPRLAAKARAFFWLIGVRIWTGKTIMLCKNT